MVFMPFSSLGVRIDVFSGVADVSFMSEVIRHIDKDVTLGEDVQIWNFTYIGKRAEKGANFKMEGKACISPLTVIGDDVFLLDRCNTDELPM